MNIVCDDGPDEAAWCEDCDARLFERRDGSMICSNGDCGRKYPAGSVNKHKRNLQPIENPYDTDGPILVAMTGTAATTYIRIIEDLQRLAATSTESQPFDPDMVYEINCADWTPRERRQYRSLATAVSLWKAMLEETCL